MRDRLDAGERVREHPRRSLGLGRSAGVGMSRELLPGAGVEHCFLEMFCRSGQALPPVGLVHWLGPGGPFPGSLAASCRLCYLFRASIHLYSELLELGQLSVQLPGPSYPTPERPLCLVAGQARPSQDPCVWPWAVPQGLGFPLAQPGRQTQSAWAPRVCAWGEGSPPPLFTLSTHCCSCLLFLFL